MIFVFGTVCLDRMRRVPFLPAQGGYVEIAEETEHLGGEAANTANALISWGVETQMYTNGIGSGYRAERLRTLIERHRLPSSLIRESATPTPVCDIYLTPDGERTMFGLGFDQMAGSVDPAELEIASDNWFTSDMNFGEVGRSCIERAAEHGVRLYLMDVIAPGSLLAKCATPTYWQSSTDWHGVRGNAQKNVVWVQRHVDAWSATVILSDGPNGLVAGRPGGRARAYPPFPAPAVVDLTGAGDMFRAGMLYGLDQEWDFARCLAFASACGSLKCQYLGATDRVPTIAEVEAHIAAHSEISSQYVG